MSACEVITVPARRGKAARLGMGQSVKVINTHGEQVVDTWAFNAADLQEFMAMEHWRVTAARISPKAGDALVTNRRRPILTLTEDTSPGVHDTLMAACDRYRYALLGCDGYHDNCTDNLFAAMEALGLHPPQVPCPLNLFMNIPVLDDGRLDFCEPVTRPGSVGLACFPVLDETHDLSINFVAEAGHEYRIPAERRGERNWIWVEDVTSGKVVAGEKPPDEKGKGKDLSAPPKQP